MSSNQFHTDTVYRNSKRETFWILLIWAVFAIWVVGVCRWLGYGADPEAPLETVLGFPKWVFWGVAMPWLAANVVIISFAVKVMADDPLSDPYVTDAPPSEPTSQKTSDPVQKV